MRKHDSAMPLPRECAVAIVGLGLMGGSLAVALRERRPDVRLLGVARRQETLCSAFERQLIDAGSTELGEILPRANVVVLAAPVRAILGQVETATSLLASESVLTDVGSTKTDIVAAMARSARSDSCVGGHPMCGRERAGLAAAQGDLFEGATWALCPTPASRPGAVAAVAGLAIAVGARPLVVAPERHDSIVSLTSHLPYAVAACLARAVAVDTSREELLALSAGGYRDTTRLAAGEAGMMLDILLGNREHVLRGLSQFRDELDRLIALLELPDEPGALGYLEQARRDRRLS